MAKKSGGDGKSGSDYKAIKREFARRLHAKMIEKKLNQSELARQAALHMPDKRFGRDNISKYLMQGKSGTLPSSLQLVALAKALRMSPEDLLPTDKSRLLSMPMADNEFEVRQTPESMFIRLNQRFPVEIGKKIVALVMQSKEDT